MATVKSAAATAGILAPEASFESIEIVQPAVPSLRITLTGPDAPTVITEGMPGVTAVEMDWGKVVGDVIDLLKKIIGSAGGGKCTTVTIQHPDGSSDTVTHCEPA